MKRDAALWWMFLFSALMLPAQMVRADDGTLDGRIVLGHSFRLENGQTLNGDLVVIGGAAAVDSGAEIIGDLVVIGGSLSMNGQVSGSAIVVGGSTTLGGSSSVGRDMVALGGAFSRADGAAIAGDIITNLDIVSGNLPRATVGPIPDFPPRSNLNFDFGPLGRLASVLFQAIGLGLIAMLFTAFLHPQLDRVAQAARLQPFAAGSFGLLTLFLAPLAIIIMAVTLILIPLAMTAAILVALAWLFGIVALGHLVGEQLLQALHRTWEPVFTAGFGAFVLGFALGTSNQIPCIGWLASLLIGLVGLGAATMTLFGTRPMPLAPRPARAAAEGAPISPAE